MAPFRMPFAGRKGSVLDEPPVNDENSRPGATPRTASKDSLALGMRNADEQPNEYKMSRVDDGVYLPPSPTEKKSFWQRTPTSTTSSNHRSFLSDNEPFSISRESFDSYRRSFDVSGRSPVRPTDSFASRASVDALSPRAFRPSLDRKTFETSGTSETTPEEEDEFQDVPLQDHPPPKKKNFLFRLGDSSPESHAVGADPAKSRFALHLPGRRKAPNGHGDELAIMDRPESPRSKSDIPVM